MVSDVRVNSQDPLTQMNRPLTRAQRRRRDSELNSLILNHFERESSLPNSFKAFIVLSCLGLEDNLTN